MLNTTLSPIEAEKLLDKMIKVIETEMPYHVKRWGTSVENWRFHLDVVRTFVKERANYMREHLKQKFNLGEQINIEVILPIQNNCEIKFNTIKVKDNFKGIYFENIPVSITVNPKHDYEFVGWEGRDEKTAELTFVPFGNVVLKPILRPKQRSLLTDSLIINEISYYQPKNDSTDDWIEIYNHSSKEIDVSSFSITTKRYKKGFFLPDGISIKAKDYLLVTKNRINFLLEYHLDSNKVIGNLDFGLSKKGSLIKLYDNLGLIVDSLSYDKKQEDIDSAFTVSLMNPDSNRFNTDHWNMESPTPLLKSISYRDYLFEQEQKAIWKKRLYTIIYTNVTLNWRLS